MIRHYRLHQACVDIEVDRWFLLSSIYFIFYIAIYLYVQTVLVRKTFKQTAHCIVSCYQATESAKNAFLIVQKQNKKSKIIYHKHFLYNIISV
jgi:hypothetical protein